MSADALDPIRARLAAVTDQGMLPWRRVTTSDGAGTGVIDSAGSVIGYGTGIPAAALLANAPADMAHLLAVIDRAEKLAKHLDGLAPGDQHYAKLIRAVISGEGA